jgi:hypothetical protein
MPSQKRDALYDMFATGNKPTQDDFADLIDSMINIVDDGIGASQAGEPMEIVQQGTKKRLLDFSSSTDNPVWRISAQSGNGVDGLNIATADQKSKLFVKKENGLTGINNENPQARLQITPDAETALLVNDRAKNTALMIDAKGNMGIGTTSRDEYKVYVDGPANFEGEITMNGLAHAEQGMLITGGQLDVQQGVDVQNGLTVKTGVLAARAGLIVSGSAINATAGAVVSGSALEARAGLTVEDGAVIKTGELIANNGISVNGAELVVNNGLVINSPAVMNDGIMINQGILTAKDGILVSDSLFTAANRVILGSPDGGNVSVNGILEANQGLLISGAELQSEQGLKVTNGDTLFNGPVNVNGALGISGSLTADCPVSLGNANKQVAVKGKMEAKAGLVVSGAEITAENGLTVNKKDLTVNSLLTANNGLKVNNSALNANGPVTLGNAVAGSVTVNGALSATNGGAVSGAQLLVRDGLRVDSTFEAPFDSKLGNAVIQTLNVTDVDIAGTLGLAAIDLNSVNAAEAQMETVTISGPLNIYGNTYVKNDILLAAGKLVATFEGPDTVTPMLIMQRGAVENEGHFELEIDDRQVVTITYDDTSNLDYFLTDWEVYRSNNQQKAKGFNFERVGTGSGNIRDTKVQLTSSNGTFQEYRVANNGVRMIYTGSSDDAAQFVIKANENAGVERFEFEITGLKLIVKYPGETAYQTVQKLLDDWSEWKSNNERIARCFEIQQTGDQSWQLIDTTSDLTLTDQVIRSYTTTGLTITNQSNAGNQPKVVINAATPSSGRGVLFSTSSNTLEIQLGETQNTPQAVYNAWQSRKSSGDELYGFDIKETADTSSLTVFQETQLMMTDPTHSRIDTASVSISYTGDNVEAARVRFQAGAGNVFVIMVSEADKLLTINYPTSSKERTIANLLAAWETVEDKLGFDIFSSGEDFIVKQEAFLDEVVAQVFEFETESRGVDKLIVSYLGFESESPQFIIQPNTGNEFQIIISTDQILTLKYPADLSGTVDELISYWETYPNKDSFRITRNEIAEAIVTDVTGLLTVNPDDYLFNKAVIRTNRVYVEGSLILGDSDLEITTISDDQSFTESSHAALPTQKAVKTYVDNGLVLKADTTVMTEELAKKADTTVMTEELAKKADLSAVTEELAKKADQAVVLPVLAAKAGLITAEAITIAAGATGLIAEITLTAGSRGLLMVRTTTATGIAKAGLFASHGTDSILKIAGEGMTAEADNAGTYNLYPVDGSITAQNATAEDVTLSLSYFGV